MTSNHKWATVAQVIEMAKDWPTKYIICRINGHGDWIPAPGSGSWQTPYGEFARAIEACGRCETRRVTEYLQKQYTVVQTARWVDEYPDGFLSTNGRIAGEARDALKKIYLDRVFNLKTQTTVKEDKYIPRSARTRVAMGMEDVA